MIKVNSCLFLPFFFFSFNLNAQNIEKILIDNQWTAFDNFAVIDFKENGKAVIEYAYCSYCQGNMDTLDWKLQNRLLILGVDSLKITTASNNEVMTQQYGHRFYFKNLKKIKASKLKKADIMNHLVTDIPLTIKVNTGQFNNSKNHQDVLFKANGRMWIEDPKYRGQWAIKSFYNQFFLVYINRFAVNRDFPLLSIKSLKKGKLIGQPIPSITKGTPFVLEIE